MAAIFLLIGFGVLANFLFLFIGNVGGLPGALLAGAPGKRSKGRFIFGSVVCAIGQSFIYLAYTAFIVSWTAARIRQGASILCWLVAFLSVITPLWINLIRARVESREQPYANPQVEGMHLTFLIVLVSFFIFAIFEGAISYTYGWLPFITSK